MKRNTRRKLVLEAGAQERLDSADDVRLAPFIAAVRSNPRAPEPGGCDGPNLWFSGGTGKPER